MNSALVLEAVRNGPTTTRKMLLDRLFAYWFGRFVYNQIWEDPRVDLTALRLQPDSRVVTIASGGCNLVNYLVDDPARVVALDLNPAHVALSRLKLAAIARLPDHEALFRFFGAADDAANRQAYQRHLAPHLDPETRHFWEARGWTGRRRVDYFATGLYRRALLGRFLGLLHLVARMAGHTPAALLAATSMDEQRRLYDVAIAPLFDLKLVKWLGRLPVLSYSLGIPAAQFDQMRQQAGGDIVGLYRERVRRLACDFPVGDNYFAWQAFSRRYDRDERRAVPDYLRPESYPVIRDRIERVEVRLASMTAYLADQPDASFDRYVLLDAQDWMNPPHLTALWRQIGRTARPGARVIFRTAAAESPLEGAVPATVLEPWLAEAELGRTLLAQDRSAIYGGFHIYSRRGDR